MVIVQLYQSGNGLVLLRITVTQYCVVMKLVSTDPTARSHRRLGYSLVAAVVITVVAGLGIWLSSSFFKDNNGVTSEESSMSASQHTMHLVRSFRISAAADTTPSTIQSIPEAVEGVEPLSCGSRFALGLEDAVTQMHGVDYLSAVAGSRASDVEQWRTQQSQAHNGATALMQLFPDECAPEVPVVFDLPDDIRFGDEVSIREVLLFSDASIEEWSQLYLLAETAKERDIARAGLWQTVRWEAAASPGRSPFAFPW